MTRNRDINLPSWLGYPRFGVQERRLLSSSMFVRHGAMYRPSQMAKWLFRSSHVSFKCFGFFASILYLYYVQNILASDLPKDGVMAWILCRF